MPSAATVFDFSGARVLVTGGSSGIGLGIASAFAGAGAEVCITGTRAAASDYEQDFSAFSYRRLQVQDRDAVAALAADLPGLDILVNNAGASLPGGRDEWEPEVFEEAVRINLLSVYEMAHACRDLLAASELPGGASVIGIASLTSFFGNEFVPGYGAAKAGLVQLTKTLGASWAKHGIRANAVAAGMIATRMTAPMQEFPEFNDAVLTRTPLKRWGQPADVAAAVLFLASAGASFITGETLLVDGGYSVFV